MRFDFGKKSTDVVPGSLHVMPLDEAISYLRYATSELTKRPNIHRPSLRVALDNFTHVAVDVVAERIDPATANQKLSTYATGIIEEMTPVHGDLADRKREGEVIAFVARGTSAMLMGHGSIIEREPEPVTRILKVLNSQCAAS